MDRYKKWMRDRLLAVIVALIFVWLLLTIPGTVSAADAELSELSESSAQTSELPESSTGESELPVGEDEAPESSESEAERPESDQTWDEADLFSMTLISDEPNENGIYNTDVGLVIGVEETESGSGIKMLEYWVTCDQVETQRETLFSFDAEETAESDPVHQWIEVITVDARLNNSSNVVVYVRTADLAGNEKEASLLLDIDITAPAIELIYDNNDVRNGKYFNASRTARIVISERTTHFDKDAVRFNISAVDASQQAVNLNAAAMISAWTTVEGEHPDEAKHTAMIYYDFDAEYRFEISYTDMAGNINEFIDTGHSAAPYTFIIDTAEPVISVSYDNNLIQNERYFNAKRTATIVIIEHNFDISRVNFNRTASLEGSAIAIPTVFWSSSGDVHTGTISYAADGDYTFDIGVTDLAGNQSKDVDYGYSAAAGAFTIDTAISKPTITGVEDGKSYKGNVIPSINLTDINFDQYEVTLLQTRKDEKNIDVTDKFIRELSVDNHGGYGVHDTFARSAENDGIYTLTVRIADKAGNAAVETVSFTVNRFGSVYIFNDYLRSLQNSYVQSVHDKLVIVEYNPDQLVPNSVKIEITCDGAPLRDVRYTVYPVIAAPVTVGESGWYQYTYVIDAENFSKDGIYRLTVSSADSAGNQPETSNFDQCQVFFRVDKTPAEITGARGLEYAIIDGESQEVRFEIFDAIGLKQITVYVDGKVVETYDTFDDLANFTGTFIIGEGENQNIRIVVEDLAGNIIDTDEQNDRGEYVFMPDFRFTRELTVSKSSLGHQSANYFNRWEFIAGAVILTIAIFLGHRIRRHKYDHTQDLH